MDTIIFGKYTVQDLAIVIGAIIVLWILVSVIRKLFKKEKVSPHVQAAYCKNCGWKGEVSRYAGTCPKCSEPLGDRIAKKEA